MSKIKLLLDVVDDMHRLADSLHAIAECIQDNSANDSARASEGGDKNECAKPTITDADIRAVLAEKSCEGKTDAARALLEKYGSKRVKDLQPVDYPVFLEEARKL